MRTGSLPPDFAAARLALAIHRRDSRLLLRRLVAGIANGALHLRDRHERGHVLHFGCVQREGDDGAGHAVELLERALDVRDAAGAGHAGDVQGDLLGGQDAAPVSSNAARRMPLPIMARSSPPGLICVKRAGFDPRQARAAAGAHAREISRGDLS